MDDVKNVLVRLENVTSRLEGICSQQRMTGGGACGGGGGGTVTNGSAIGKLIM